MSFRTFVKCLLLWLVLDLLAVVAMLGYVRWHRHAYPAAPVKTNAQSTHDQPMVTWTRMTTPNGPCPLGWSREQHGGQEQCVAANFGDMQPPAVLKTLVDNTTIEQTLFEVGPYPPGFKCPAGYEQRDCALKCSPPGCWDQNSGQTHECWVGCKTADDVR